MTVKQALNQLREADREISILESARAEAWAQATRATTAPVQSGIRTENDPHRFDELAVLGDELSRKINDLAAAKTAAVRIIYSLDDPRYREVLAAYYIDCRTPTGQRKTWDVVADELCLSLRCVMRSYGLALNALAELYPGEAPCPVVHSGPVPASGRGGAGVAC